MELEKIVTIVVPIYNVEEYIKQCLNSLLFEDEAKVVLVDDGSTDSSGEIAKVYASNYDNFIYIYKKNGGLSSARNEGMKYCNTKYIAFCDSDDWVEKNTYTKLAKIAKQEECDIVSCGMYLNYDDKEIKISLKNATYDLTNNIQLVELLNNIKPSAWDKVYKYNLFSDNNISYPFGLYFEDTPTTAMLLVEAKKVKLLNESFYHYRQRVGSIINQDYFQEKYFDIFKGLDILKNYQTNQIEKQTLIYNYFYFRKGLLDTIIRLNRFNVFKERKYRELIKNKITLNSFLEFKGKFKYKIYVLYYWFRTFI